MPLVLASDARQTMLAAARTAYPFEACGLLFGERHEETLVVASASVAANIASDPQHRFEVDPAHLVATQRAHRAGGPAILGVWHSHPEGPLRPSAADRAGVTDPSWVWIIVAPPALAAFLPDPLHPGGFRPLREIEALSM
ncbi:M67 family metallopeptidase [Thermaurantiacus sp.]